MHSVQINSVDITPQISGFSFVVNRPNPGMNVELVVTVRYSQVPTLPLRIDVGHAVAWEIDGQNAFTGTVREVKTTVAPGQELVYCILDITCDGMSDLF